MLFRLEKMFQFSQCLETKEILFYHKRSFVILDYLLSIAHFNRKDNRQGQAPFCNNMESDAPYLETYIEIMRTLFEWILLQLFRNSDSFLL